MATSPMTFSEFCSVLRRKGASACFSVPVHFGAGPFRERSAGNASAEQ